MANMNNCLKLSTRELDLVILANIQAVVRVDNVGEKRNRSPRCHFLFQFKPIFCEMFLTLYGLSYSRVCRLKEHYENNGLSSRTHGNTKPLPPNTLLHAVVEDVKVFVTNYVEENAISVPEGFPGTKMRTLNYYHVMKQKWVSGAFLNPHARQLESKQCATQSLLNCGNSFIQISWL